jgi:hypothetical protein
MVQTCKHPGVDPFASLKEALPGLFALWDETGHVTGRAALVASFPNV